MAYVYRHIREDKNEVFYIGIGADNKGYYSRSKKTKLRNPHWENIVNKTNYYIEIVLDDLTQEEAKIKEGEFIKLYGRKDLGLGTLVNMTDGGDGLSNISEETRTKMRNSHIGQKRVFSEEHKLKISLALKGKVSEKSLENLKKWKGSKHTLDAKEKISKATIGENNGFYGKKHTPETKNKMKLTKNI